VYFYGQLDLNIDIHLTMGINLSLKCKLRIWIRSINTNSYKKISLAACFFISAPFLELITSNEWGMSQFIRQPHWYYLWYGIKTNGNVVALLPYWLAYSGQKQNKHLATTQTMIYCCSFLTSGNNVTDITFHTYMFTQFICYSLNYLLPISLPYKF